MPIHDETIYEAEVVVHKPQPLLLKQWLALLSSPTGRPFLFTVMRDAAPEMCEGRTLDAVLERIDEMAECWERPPEEWELYREVGRDDGRWRLSYFTGIGILRDENVYSSFVIDSFPGLDVGVEAPGQWEPSTTGSFEQAWARAHRSIEASQASIASMTARLRKLIFSPAPYPKPTHRLDGQRWKKK